MNQTIYYSGLFLASFILTFLYICQWNKHFNLYMTVFFILLPIVNLSFYLIHSSHEAETAAALMNFVNIGSCFIPWIMTMCEIDLCQIPARRQVRIISFLISAGLFLCQLAASNTGSLYHSLTMDQAGSAWALRKGYGPLQTVHYIFLAFYFIADLAIFIYAIRNKKQVSRTVLMILSIPFFITAAGSFAGFSMSRVGYDLAPLYYLMMQIIYILVAHRMVYYNVSEMIIESMAESGSVGFISVDSKGKYLGSNETARRILPELNLLTIDRPIHNEKTLENTVIKWMQEFRENPRNYSFLYNPEGEDNTTGKKIYKVRVSDLYYGKECIGIQFFIEDDSENQIYIRAINRLLDRYDNELQAEVAARTKRIVEMHDRFVLGMAMMVESRDNSTGGHIRRTSECVRLLTEEIKADGSLQLSDEFCEKLIKAAPMHDLGKIAVDDAILRKPGRFTPEEFEKMKNHAAEGDHIVHTVLQDTDDEVFLRIAENIAHYHHERFDGSGYPKGLKGEEIPMEARIMALADVYDALVSKRVYKDSFSFEEADRIILEGMGSQFDPRLQRYYEKARPKLEAYYTELKEAEAIPAS